VLPAATTYQSRLLDNVTKLTQLFPNNDTLTAQNRNLILQIAQFSNDIAQGVDKLVNERKIANKIESERAKAVAYHDKVVPLMDEIRSYIDALELIVDNELWTLPKYRELLFVR